MTQFFNRSFFFTFIGVVILATAFQGFESGVRALFAGQLSFHYDAWAYSLLCGSAIALILPWFQLFFFKEWLMTRTLQISEVYAAIWRSYLRGFFFLLASGTGLYVLERGLDLQWTPPVLELLLFPMLITFHILAFVAGHARTRKWQILVFLVLFFMVGLKLSTVAFYGFLLLTLWVLFQVKHSPRTSLLFKNQDINTLFFLEVGHFKMAPGKGQRFFALARVGYLQYLGLSTALAGLGLLLMLLLLPSLGPEESVLLSFLPLWAVLSLMALLPTEILWRKHREYLLTRPYTVSEVKTANLLMQGLLLAGTLGISSLWLYHSGITLRVSFVLFFVFLWLAGPHVLVPFALLWALGSSFSPGTISLLISQWSPFLVAAWALVIFWRVMPYACPRLKWQSQFSYTLLLTFILGLGAYQHPLLHLLHFENLLLPHQRWHTSRNLYLTLWFEQAEKLSKKDTFASAFDAYSPQVIKKALPIKHNRGGAIMAKHHVDALFNLFETRFPSSSYTSQDEQEFVARLSRYWLRYTQNAQISFRPLLLQLEGHHYSARRLARAQWKRQRDAFSGLQWAEIEALQLRRRRAQEVYKQLIAEQPKAAVPAHLKLLNYAYYRQDISLAEKKALANQARHAGVSMTPFMWNAYFSEKAEAERIQTRQKNQQERHRRLKQKWEKAQTGLSTDPAKRLFSMVWLAIELQQENKDLQALKALLTPDEITRLGHLLEEIPEFKKQVSTMIKGNSDGIFYSTLNGMYLSWHYRVELELEPQKFPHLHELFQEMYRNEKHKQDI